MATKRAVVGKRKTVAETTPKRSQHGLPGLDLPFLSFDNEAHLILNRISSQISLESGRHLARQAERDERHKDMHGRILNAVGLVEDRILEKLAELLRTINPRSAEPRGTSLLEAVPAEGTPAGWRITAESAPPPYRVVLGLSNVGPSWPYTMELVSRSRDDVWSNNSGRTTPPRVWHPVPEVPSTSFGFPE